MSAAMGGAAANSQASARAPEKGSFPLDHFNECKSLMELKQTSAYLECRMNKGLMAEEKISNFGLDQPIDIEASQQAHQEYLERQKLKREHGFVAGMARADRRT